MQLGPDGERGERRAEVHTKSATPGVAYGPRYVPSPPPVCFQHLSRSTCLALGVAATSKAIAGMNMMGFPKPFSSLPFQSDQNVS